MQVRSKLPDVGTTIFTVMSQLAVEHGAVNLGQGFPDFEPPTLLGEALARAVASGKNQYAPMPGILPLREQIAAKVERLYGGLGGRPVRPADEVTVTPGATEALFAAIMAFVAPGDEVVLLDPAYDSYAPAVALSGGRAVRVDLCAPSFAVDWERVRAALTPRTRMIIVNSPHNPTGAVLSEGDLDALAELAVAHDLLILSDEVYEHIFFDGRAHRSLLGHPALAARSVVVSSFGKTYHCTGWKMGYVVAPAPLTAELRKVHQYLTFCAFAPAQWALAELMERAPAHERVLSAFYQEKRDRLRALLAPGRLRLLPTGGSYFMIADYSAIDDRDDRAFCEWLVRERGVAAIPLSPFYARPPRGQRLIRLCFAKRDETLASAAERLLPL